MAESFPPTARGHFVTLRDNVKLAFWLFLGGEVVFFTTLILTFILLRVIKPDVYSGFRQHLSIPLIGINTFLLITSSYFVVRALEALQDDQPRKYARFLIGVIVLGALFLAGQAFEWFTLFKEGVNIQDVFGTPFFTVTGIHGTHVFLGLIWALVLLFTRKSKAYTATRHSPVETFGLYWHFVDIVWIVLFTVIYLI